MIPQFFRDVSCSLPIGSCFMSFMLFILYNKISLKTRRNKGLYLVFFGKEFIDPSSLKGYNVL